MSEQQKTQDRIEELINYKLKQNDFDYVNIRESLSAIFSKNVNIDFIYPKNLYNASEHEKVFYVFHGNFVSKVIKKESHFEVHTLPFEVARLDYVLPQEPERKGAFLTIELTCNVDFNLNSREDNDEAVIKPFTKLIQEIYSHSISR